MELIKEEILMDIIEAKKDIENDQMLKPHLEKSSDITGSSSYIVGLLDHQKLMIATDDDEISCPFKDNFGKSSLSGNLLCISKK